MNRKNIYKKIHIQMNIHIKKYIYRKIKTSIWRNIQGERYIQRKETHMNKHMNRDIYKRKNIYGGIYT